MTDRPRADLPERYRVTAVVIGGVIGIVLVLSTVADLGVLEIALVLLPVLVFAAPVLGYLLWARRRDRL